jgi:hypothetical protein
MIQKSPVLILMAIDAEVFPIAAVAGVVVMVMVFVMNGKQMKVFQCEFAPTPSANPWMNPQRLLPVAFIL